MKDDIGREWKGFFAPNNFQTHPRHLAAKEYVKRRLFGDSEPTTTTIHRAGHVFSARLGAESQIIERALCESFQALPMTLKNAYQATNYNVDALNFAIKIRERSSELLALYEEKKVTTAVYITAENPDSECVSQGENTFATAKLYKYLCEKGYLSYEGFGCSSGGDWAGERSYLVLGMPCGEAIWLASYFGQMAFVWCGTDAIPLVVPVGGKKTQDIHLESFEQDFNALYSR